MLDLSLLYVQKDAHNLAHNNLYCFIMEKTCYYFSQLRSRAQYESQLYTTCKKDISKPTEKWSAGEKWGQQVTALLSCTGLVPAVKTAAYSALCSCRRVWGRWGVLQVQGMGVCLCVAENRRVELEFSPILQNKERFFPRLEQLSQNIRTFAKTSTCTILSRPFNLGKKYVTHLYGVIASWQSLVR